MKIDNVFCINPDHLQKYPNCEGCFNISKCKAELNELIGEASNLEQQVETLLAVTNAPITIVDIECETCPFKDICEFKDEINNEDE